jgi:hypothetical protein
LPLLLPVMPSSALLQQAQTVGLALAGATMGVSASTLMQLITEEFTRLSNGNTYLTLDEMLQFRINIGLNIDLESVAVLFDLDRCAPLPSCFRMHRNSSEEVV